MLGVALRSEYTSRGLMTVIGPVNQGSMRMVKDPGDDAEASKGANVSRKHVSPFKDRAVSDMLKSPGRRKLARV